MIYTESEKDSLDKFMRGFSPLNEFARSIRGEGEASSQTSAENDPFAGINIDDLPDDLKATITKAKGSFAALQTSEATAKVEQEKAIKLARENQARADRHFEQLRKHNLVNTEGKPTTNATEGDDPMLATLAENLRKEHGLAPDAALAHAKIQLTTFKSLKPELFREISTGLNPTLAAVGEMHAGKLLAEAQLPKNDSQGWMQIPEVATNVQQNLDLLVKQGATINFETITNLKAMAFGNHFQTLTPEKQTALMNPQRQTTQFSTGGPAFGQTGNLATLQTSQFQQSGKPVAANSETAEAAAKTLAAMSTGFIFKKGGK